MKRKIAFFFLIHSRYFEFTENKYIVSWYVETIWSESRRTAYYDYFSSIYTGVSRLDIGSRTPDYFKYLGSADTTSVNAVYAKGKIKALKKAIHIVKTWYDEKAVSRLMKKLTRYEEGEYIK